MPLRTRRMSLLRLHSQNVSPMNNPVPAADKSFHGTTQNVIIAGEIGSFEFP